jgi:UDP-GlcNAc:undecaprenyl-phosphate GlcNAc-1-phosphate transferase
MTPLPQNDRSNLVIPLVFGLVLATAGGIGLFVAAAHFLMFPVLALATGAALVLTPLAIHLSYRFRVLDVPDARKTHERPMPLLGGAAVAAAFAVACLLAMQTLPAGTIRPGLMTQLAATLAGAGFVAAMGIADDKWGLRPAIRLVGQLAAVCLVIRYGVVMTFLPPTALGRLGEAALTAAWVIGITNALNFLDGLDGLAAGVTIVAAVFFGAIAGITGQWGLAAVSFALAGAGLGFLKYNFRPASIYLGDSGATFLGFTLACIGILGEWGRPDRIENLFVPIIILGIPIYDTVYITIYRIRKGIVRNLTQWVTYVGRDHLHHRLLQLGMRPERACLFICLGGVTLGILAAILQTKGPLDRYDKFLALVVAALMFIGVTVLMEVGKARQRNGG